MLFHCVRIHITYVIIIQVLGNRLECATKADPDREDAETRAENVAAGEVEAGIEVEEVDGAGTGRPHLQSVLHCVYFRSTFCLI